MTHAMEMGPKKRVRTRVRAASVGAMGGAPALGEAIAQTIEFVVPQFTGEALVIPPGPRSLLWMLGAGLGALGAGWLPSRDD